MTRNPMNRCAAALALVSLGAGRPAAAAWTVNMTEGVTAMQNRVYDLHMLMFWICVVIGTGVFGAMLYSVVRHRKSRGVTAANFHESTWVEIGWTVVPFLVLIAVAIPAAGTLLRLENSGGANLTIRVTGHQWLWEYGYVDSGVHFYSRLDAASNRARQKNSGVDPSNVPHYLRAVDHPLVVPVDEKVRLLITSGDVNHSWWVPALGGKKDAIPGFINDQWFKADKIGTYRGQCAELCGRGHAFMPIVVKVVSKADYGRWLAKNGGHANPELKRTLAAAANTDASNAAARTTPAAKPAPENQAASAGQATHAGEAGEAKAQLMAHGKQVYGNLCAACHQADGSGLPAAGFPAMKNSAVVTGPIAGHIKQVLQGKGAMPAFAGALSDDDIAAVVTYERNAFGNHTGDVVQPTQVAEQR